MLNVHQKLFHCLYGRSIWLTNYQEKMNSLPDFSIYNIPIYDEKLLLQLKDVLEVEALAIKFTKPKSNFVLTINSHKIDCQKKIIYHFCKHKKLKLNKRKLQVKVDFPKMLNDDSPNNENLSSYVEEYEELHNNAIENDKNILNNDKKNNKENIKNKSNDENQNEYDENEANMTIHQSDLVILKMKNFFNAKAITITRSDIPFLREIAKKLEIHIFLELCEFFDRFYSLYDKLEPLADIQREIMEINDGFIEDVVESIKSSLLVSDLNLLYHLLMIAFTNRPNFLSIYIEIIKILDEDGIDIINVFRKRLLGNYNTFSNETYLLYEFMINGIFTQDEVLTTIKQSTNINGKIWFAPFLKDDKLFIQNIEDNLNSIFKPHIRAEKVTLFNKLRENDWQLHKTLVAEKKNHTKLAKIIREDNVNELQKMISFDHEVNIYSTIKWSPFETNNLLINKPTLIQYAAFHQSVKCFKFLFLNQANISKPDSKKRYVLDYAIAGGSIEIVRICVQEGLELLNALGTAAMFHQYELFNWLKDNVVNINKSKDAIFSRAINDAIESFNYDAILQLFGKSSLSTAFTAAASDNELLLDIFMLFDFVHKLDILVVVPQSKNLSLFTHVYNQISSKEKLDSQEGRISINEAAAHVVCLDVVDILEFIDSKHQIDYYELITEENDIIKLAVECGAIKCLKYIAERPDFNIDQWNKEDYALLREATMYNQVEIVRFLLSLEGLNINAIDKGGGSAFTAATWDNQIPIARILYDHGDVDINLIGKIGETPLTGAVLQDIPQMMNFLLQLPEIDVYKKNQCGKTSMMLIIQESNFQCYNELLKSPKFDVNNELSCGGLSTPVYAYKYCDSLAMIEIILNTPTLDKNKVDSTLNKTYKELLEDKIERLEKKC
ncbi:hypothetical protein TRFO_30050 [Tritrichomonas foetus]|uniref:DUF3447 domain-containing protein n=1 Tax=Tritrichomonas foetus TaxID=1144522 RepID=A0A1J4JZ21_9EUKA|nr:hypothetical protein TRFO_30050 [Tritrichomonas foetus]|eukprot:OHT02742.1 hypothetical protein TRFO_30050 [Tritrichomonas foetus]